MKFKTVLASIILFVPHCLPELVYFQIDALALSKTVRGNSWKVKCIRHHCQC